MSHHVSWDAYPIPDDLPPIVINDPTLPLVSIVTPTYNQGRFIRETIESVLTQDYPNIEYWVIDGASTDETVSILETYDDPRFHWISERDDGQSDAINKGWSRCRGEIFAWLNSDDFYLPDAIRIQVNALLHHPECGAVYGDVLYIGPDGEPIYRGYGHRYRVLDLLRLSIPAQPTTFVRRSICERVGTVNKHFRHSLDSEYWIRAARVAPFWYEPECIATYRLHDTSKTIAGHRGFYREWLAITEAFFSDPDLPRAYAKQERWVFADIYARIATIEVEQGSLSEASRYLVKALKGGFRVRMLKLLPLLVDRYLPFRMTPRLTQWWTRLQSQRRTAAESQPV